MITIFKRIQPGKDALLLKRNYHFYRENIPDGRYWGNGTFDPLPPTATASFLATGHSDLDVSQGNAWRKLGESRDRIGGAFSVKHRRIVREQIIPKTYYSNVNISGGGRTKRYWGHVTAQANALDLNSNGWPDFLYSSGSDLDSFGTTAIANVEPTNPLSGLTVTLAELKREGIPSLPGIRSWEGRTSLAKSAGQEYLNKEFGWDPLIGEIRNTVNVARQHDKLVAQFERGSGNRIHRQYGPFKERTVTDISHPTIAPLWPGFGNQHFVAPPKWSQILTVEKTRWYEGCFTYYLPPFDPDGSNFERNRLIAKKLYGLGITPEVLWDITPWSWAIDWVSNAGDVFHNIGAFRDNGLVMHYGYVMETIVHRLETRVWDIRSRESEWPPPNGDGSPRRTQCESIVESTTKVRRVATPYGFGLDWNGFNPFQLSILTALGISR